MAECIHCGKMHDASGMLPLCLRCTKAHVRAMGCAIVTRERLRELTRLAFPGAGQLTAAGRR